MAQHQNYHDETEDQAILITQYIPDWLTYYAYIRWHVPTHTMMQFGLSKLNWTRANCSLLSVVGTIDTSPISIKTQRNINQNTSHQMQLRKWCDDIIVTFEGLFSSYNLPEWLHKNIIVHHVLTLYHRPSRRAKPSTVV